MRAVSSLSCTLKRFSKRLRRKGEISRLKWDMLERVRRRRVDWGVSIGV